jgi:hypothetical protein
MDAKGPENAEILFKIIKSLRPLRLCELRVVSRVPLTQEHYREIP